MSHNHLVGVGGSGCRCIESVIHFAAAGLGPSSLTLAYVDADRGNGNLQRATDLAGLYTRLWKSFRQAGASHRLSEDLPWLRTEIRHGPEHFWSPVPDGGDHTLSGLFNYAATMPNPERALFDSLFSSRSGSNEKTMRLNEGYRGRPHIGAAVTGARASSRHAFWADMANVIRKAKEGEKVRIFLIGSIFGGTGASGFPVIARKVRYLLEKHQVNAGVTVGGALLLPYFRYPRPDPERHRDAIASDVFLPQAQAALRYYQQMMKAAPLFDNLYVVGWPSLIETKSSEPGGRAQANPPMAPEMVVANAAMRFFRQEEIQPGKLYVPGWSPQAKFDWSYLPTAVADGLPTPKRAFAQLLRFAFALNRVYGPYLGDDLVAEVEDHPWFLRLIAEANVDVRDDSVRKVVKDAADFCEMVMRWCASINFVSKTDAMDVNLFTAQALASNDTWRDGLAELHTRLEATHEDFFPNLVPDGEGSELWELYDDLTYKPVADGDGLGAFVGTLYRQCAVNT
jgi:hypothetical protein